MEHSLTDRPGPASEKPDVDWVGRARELAPVIAAAGDRIESAREVPADVVATMHEAALFRMLLPRALGGGEAAPTALAQVCETVAAADASTGWCLGQGLGCTIAAGYLDPAAAREIFDPPDAVLATGQPSPASRAIPVEGGYRVTGQWPYGSGSRHATWLGGHSVVCEPDGTPKSDDHGRPVFRTMLFPRSSARMIDVWQVVGLKGTGSDSYEVEDLFVPETHTFWRDSAADRREAGPLYRIPQLTIYGIAFCGVALGIARAMLDEFEALAASKVAGGQRTVLRENAVIQSQTAQAEARLLSGRAFLFETLDEYWRTLCGGGEPSLDLRARMRLAITFGMNQAREAADFPFQAAGTTAIFESNPFERRFRDIHTVAAQGQAHVSNYEPVGQVFLGLEPSGHRV